MNRRLYERTGGEDAGLPETVEEKLSVPGHVARRAKFNTWGTLLAVGNFDGSVGIWDFGTRAIVKVLKGHTYVDDGYVCSCDYPRVFLKSTRPRRRPHGRPPGE